MERSQGASPAVLSNLGRKKKIETTSESLQLFISCFIKTTTYYWQICSCVKGSGHYW